MSPSPHQNIEPDALSRPLRIKLTDVRFATGEDLRLVGNDLVLITGPNNAGKSLWLRELEACLREGELAANVIIRKVQYQPLFSADDARVYFDANFVRDARGSYGAHGVSVDATWFETASASQVQLWSLSSLFFTRLGTESRIMGMDTPGSYDRTRKHPNHPVHYMFHYDETERAVSAAFRAAFNLDLILHRQALPQFPLYVGDRPTMQPGENWASTAYLERLERLPRLQNQGDGMRSFATVVGSAVALDRSILVIDEPEAFLHPPQARLLGRLISERRAQGAQVFVATHSADFIKGVMDSNPDALHLGRLTRAPTASTFWVEPAAIKSFLADPLLRTTNALDSMLHDETVITEADRDSVFYGAMLAALSSEVVRKDRMFLHTGGKHRLPALVSALRQLGVSPLVIVDIDLLRTEDVLKSLLLAYGADPEPLLKKVRRIAADVDQQSPSISGRTFKAEVEASLDKITDPAKAVPREVTRGLEAALKSLSPWAIVKSVGVSYLRGQTATTYQELDTDLRAVGINLVPVGELEGFVRTGERKGQRWLEDALSRDLNTDPDLREARDFVVKLFGT